MSKPRGDPTWGVHADPLLWLWRVSVPVLPRRGPWGMPQARAELCVCTCACVCVQWVVVCAHMHAHVCSVCVCACVCACVHVCVHMSGVCVFIHVCAVWILCMCVWCASLYTCINMGGLGGESLRDGHPKVSYDRLPPSQPWSCSGDERGNTLSLWKSPAPMASRCSDCKRPA